MHGPAYATQEKPIHTEIRGRKIKLWIGGFYVSMSGPARESRPHWIIEMDGVSRAGPDLDLDRHNSMQGVQKMLGDWASGHPDLFE